MRAVKCCMEEGHSDRFQFVLSDLESNFDFGCPENSRKYRCTPVNKAHIKIKMSHCRLWYELEGPTRTARLPQARGM